ncbi:hypothetical protein ACFLS9_07385 [Bacteroidota bacterium]
MSGVISVVPWETPLTPIHFSPSGMMTAAETPFPLNDSSPLSKASCNFSPNVSSCFGSDGESLEQDMKFKVNRNRRTNTNNIFFIS